MRAPSYQPRALGGGPLKGDKPVRFIYADEAGTSHGEPIAVVAGVIVHADTQWRPLEAALAQAFDQHVPASLRKGFVFHATEVFHGNKWREVWPLEDRMRLYDAVLAIPFRLSAAISIAAARGGPDTHDRHRRAFGMFALSTNQFLQEHVPDSEVAYLVCEDVPAMRRHLADLFDEFASGRAGDVLRLERIVDCPHWVSKAHAPLLQFADAVAFATRRFLEERPHGAQLMKALLRADDAQPLIWRNNHAFLLLHREGEAIRNQGLLFGPAAPMEPSP
jgi:hypothetical protein